MSMDLSILGDRTLGKHWSIYLQLHTTWVVSSSKYFQCQPIIYAQPRICRSLQVLVLQCCRGECRVWYWPGAVCTADTELRPEFGQYHDIRQSQHCLIELQTNVLEVLQSRRRTLLGHGCILSYSCPFFRVFASLSQFHVYLPWHGVLILS